jgi:hypothetical protein
LALWCLSVFLTYSLFKSKGASSGNFWAKAIFLYLSVIIS